MAQYINKLDHPWDIFAWIGLIVGIILVAWVLTRINKAAFRRIRRKKSGIYLSFLEHFNSALIVIVFVIIAISSFSGFKSVWQTMLGGTAVISAVLAFAAQDVIKDILAGLMISIHHPFEVGDRIVLDNGTFGIVESMTMRHVVLIGIDTVRHIIPNSKLNSMQLSNFSYHREDRSIQFRFSVGYDSDMAKVKEVIEQAVAESEYSIPALKDESGQPRYAYAYFISLADSALIVHVTVYYKKGVTGETVMDDINTRVRDALIANDIEIPYNYVNVINKSGGGDE